MQGELTMSMSLIDELRSRIQQRRRALRMLQARAIGQSPLLDRLRQITDGIRERIRQRLPQSQSQPSIMNIVSPSPTVVGVPAVEEAQVVQPGRDFVFG